MRDAGSAPPRRDVDLVPQWLAVAGAWSWRMIATGVVVWGAVWLLSTLELVVLPCLAALVFTAVLRPAVSRMRASGVPRLAAAWIVFVVAFVVVAGVGTFVVYRAVVEWPSLVRQVDHTVTAVRDWLVNGPFHVKRSDLNGLGDKLSAQIKTHEGTLLHGLVTGVAAVGEFLGASVLTAFITFFLLYDGERIWRFVARPLARGHARRIDAAAGAAWHTLSGYVRGSLVIATFHAAVIAVTLVIIGVPLVAPLALIVFVFSFLPLIGVLVSGALAVTITLSTHGLVPGLAVLIVLLVEHQVESHVLQPFVMGRYVRLHPLVIALALTAGALLGGIVGAIVAVPVVAMVNAAWPLLRPGEPEIVVSPATGP